VRIEFVEVHTSSKSSSRTLVEANSSKTVFLGLLLGVENFIHGRSCDVVVEEWVGEFFELVEVDNFAIAVDGKLTGFVEDFLDIGLAAWCGIDFSANFFEPVETLLRHVLWKNSNGWNAKKEGVEGTATAVVAGGWPESFLGGGIKGTSDHTGNKRTIGGTDLVAASGETLANHDIDWSFDTGNALGNGEIVDAAEAASLDIVVPADTEEVEWIFVPETNSLQLLDKFGWNLLWMSKLVEGWENDLAFLAAFDGLVENILVNNFSVNPL